MLNLVWLLLPVAAVAGWFAAKRNSRKHPEALWDYSSQFHAGLNVLLNDSNEKPETLFSEFSSIDNDTADTHLAIGNLYRRRGEIDRAIVMHQSLVDNNELDKDIRAAARYELARDYDSAGLLDRSETVFRELLDSGERTADAYESLLQLNEREKDWATAIEMAKESVAATGEARPVLIAHYYCEMAQEALDSGYTDEAKSLLNKAQESSAQSARANVMLASLAYNNNEYAEAIKHFSVVEQQRPELMPEIITPWFESLARLQDEDAIRRFVDHVRARKNAYSVIHSTRSVIEKLDGVQQADAFFIDQILKRPSLKGLRDWAHDQLGKSKPEERDKVQIMCKMLDQVVEDKPGYQCASCGFSGNEFHWRCPSCGTWDSVHTIIGAEGE
jgi:lipopolysaccharide biosynthesis regulator YciM